MNGSTGTHGFWGLLAAPIAALGLALPATAGAARADAGGRWRPSAQVTLASPVVHLPLEFSDGHVAVDVLVNGRGPFRFLLDTGAGVEACIDDDLAGLLALQSTGTVLSGDGSGRNVTRRGLVRIDGIEVGGLRAENVTAIVADLEWLRRPGELPVNGVLGLPLFRDLLLTVDYPGERLVLTSGRLSDGGEHVLPYDDSRGVPDVQVTVGRRRLRALIDTGARAAASFPGALAASLATVSTLVPLGTVRTLNNEFEAVGGILRAPLSIAGYRLQGVGARFASKDSQVVLGGTLLRHFALTFDQANRLIRLTHPG